MRHDGRRMFLTAVLVYAAFWNPRPDASMAWNVLGAGRRGRLLATAAGLRLMVNQAGRLPLAADERLPCAS
jgi:hypothetical protein